jgi:hypothetical protein
MVRGLGHNLASQRSKHSLIRTLDWPEQWRLLEYRTPVRTAQETHYVSATEPRQLMLCKI